MARFAPFAVLVLTAGLSPGAVALAAPAEQGAFERGEALARKNCSSCHAIGRSGASPNPKSPPFRYLSRRYPLSNLEEALGEGIVVGHEGPEMPQFEFSTKQIEALLAYLGAIQKR